MELTKNQKRLIAIRPHFEKIFNGQASAGTVPVTDALVTKQPYCIHRGKLLDVTTCKCKVWACAIHTTCSNSARSGLKLCQGCDDYQSSTLEKPATT